MIDVCILGSCVSRDIFRFGDSKKYSITYFARTSLISLVSDPISIDDNKVKLDSEFQKRMVLQDLQKYFFDHLATTEIDYLLLDFIDERFDLFKIMNSYITRSNELVNSGLIDSFTDGFEHIWRQQETTHLLWEQSCLTFISKLNQLVPEIKIILHETYWSDRYWDKQEFKYFPDKMQPGIKSMNDMLRRYYSFFKQNFSNIDVVSDSGFGDSDHVWGLSPYHFHTGYYESLYRQIENIAR